MRLGRRLLRRPSGKDILAMTLRGRVRKFKTVRVLAFAVWRSRMNAKVHGSDVYAAHAMQKRH